MWENILFSVFVVVVSTGIYLITHWPDDAPKRVLGPRVVNLPKDEVDKFLESDLSQLSR